MNKLVVDEFGRPSGLLLVDKPAGITSHDVVDKVRSLLQYKKVGHAGALDVFSSGLLLILVGKATKLSNELLVQDKAYQARVIFGIATETQDPEGKVIKNEPGIKLTKPKLTKALAGFEGGYEQYVSPFSSIKVGGKKLRKVLRDPSFSYEIVSRDQGKFIVLTRKNGSGEQIEIAIPKRKIEIMASKLDGYGVVSAADLPFRELAREQEYFYADIYIKCSKGTYVRQLAEDLGEVLKVPAALSSLVRTAIGTYQTGDAIPYPELGSVLNSQRS